jgi:transposase
MTLKKYDLPPNSELRGFRFKIYPTIEQQDHLLALGASLKSVWNWLVKIREDSDEAVESFAIREGLMFEHPKPPGNPTEGTTPEQTQLAWDDYKQRSREWYDELRTATKDHENCVRRGLREWMQYYEVNQDYQMLKRVASWHDQELGSHLLQNLARTYAESFKKGRRPAKFKRRHDPMPIGVRSGVCFSSPMKYKKVPDLSATSPTQQRREDLIRNNLGLIRNNPGPRGVRGANPEFYNCSVKLDGMQIAGRLPGRPPPGRVLQGVRITRSIDGWYASITCVCPKRVSSPIPGTVVGIDVGLDCLAAMFGDGLDPRGVLVTNPRTLVTDQCIENLYQAARDTRNDVHRQTAARLECRLARMVKHKIYNEIIKPLESVETVVVEELSPKIGQMGSRKVSAMRLIVSLLKERYGERVREVDCAYTSQDCSHCGYRSKESWSYNNGAWGKCSSCGHTENRDINAARNIRAKAMNLLKKAA